MNLNETKNIVIELQYLPCISYFQSLSQAEEVIIDVGENYEKQSYRNRCRILTSHGIQVLSVPIVKAPRKQPLKDVTIDYDQKWLNVHWRAIYSAYGKAPFFEYFAEEFKDIYYKKHKYLLDLNLDFLTLCLKSLRRNINYRLSEKYVDLAENSFITDLRSKIHPTKELMNEHASAIPEYNQVFGKGFVKNLSIIDLIFCEGPNANNLLYQTLKKNAITFT